MSDSTTFDLRFTGDYALGASAAMAAQAAFVEHGNTTNGGATSAELDLAFPLDGSWEAVGVRVEQDDKGLRAHLVANPMNASVGEVRGHLERMFSLDTEGAQFASVAPGDAVVADLRRRLPGVRPVLFSSPYEASARAIIGHRLSRRQAAAVAARISDEHGTAVDVGHVMHAFPAPARLADLAPVRGLSERKVDQLRALGRAADGNRLSAERLRAVPPDEAMTRLRELPGIGPFSAELVLIRGVGDPDVFPRTEPSLHRGMIAAYHLASSADLAALERIADTWRPYRSWVGLLVRHLGE